MASMHGTRKALDILRSLPRVGISNIRDNPGARTKKHGRKTGRNGRGKKGHNRSNSKPPLGYAGHDTPFFIRVPCYPYYQGHDLRRQYFPLTLYRLQYLIDVGRIDPCQPIDLTTLVNARAVEDIRVEEKVYGIQLLSEGADIFQAKVNIEVQWSTELALATVEKQGGIITNTYYDLMSVKALVHPLKFFVRGQPIPLRGLPSEDCLLYYTDPAQRGYLARPEKVAAERLALAKKYGYSLPDVTADPHFDMLTTKKDPRQVFHGLQPGWVVNLKDKTVLKPTEPELVDYYKNWVY